jgi:Spy/CpxP family protein refolding chaperone
MKRPVFLTAISTASAAVVLSLAVAATANAQAGAPNGRFQRGGFGQRGGMGRNMFGTMFRSMSQWSLLRMDPTRSNIAILLRRNDVRSELLLDGHQQMQLNEAMQQNQQQFGQQMRSARQDIRQQAQQGGQNPRDMTPEERQAFRQQQQQQMQTRMAQITNSQDKALEALLTPTQVARLHQLDLQWRSAMALADSTLADKLNLTQDQRPQVNAVLQSFRQAQRDAMRTVFAPPPAPDNSAAPNGQAQSGNPQNVAPQNGNPQNGNPQGAPPNNRFGRPNLTPEQMQAMMAEIPQRIKTGEASMDKARKTDNAKVLALLTSEQKQQWIAMLGKPFYFNPAATDALETSNPNNNQ